MNNTRIKVSYDVDSDLDFIRARLQGRILKITKQPPKGRFKRAYVVLKEPVETTQDGGK